MVYVKPKQQKTRELSFLHTFKESGFFNKYTSNKEDNFIFVEEPYTGFGYPDLVLLTWNKNIKNLWTKERNKLTHDDIKVMQHLYNSEIAKTIQEISTDLGFSFRQLHNIFDRLYEAKIVTFNKDAWQLRNIEDVFFIENIVTIEAKLKNWKSALIQASNSEHFSSEVFTLYPDSIINETLINSHLNSSVGIISFNHDYKVIKTANEKRIPITINGWLFNEFIGRTLWKNN